MTNRTCSVQGCDLPVKRKAFCYGHYMKAWRHGTPTPPPYVPTNAALQGRRFGTLTVERREASQWVCRCDCGAEVRTGTNNLLERGQRSCRRCFAYSRRTDDAGYGSAHERVRRERGQASTHACVDCGERAAQWSYDHADADELTGPMGGALVAYSLKVQHYEPRCVSCHKRFDLGRVDANSPT